MQICQHVQPFFPGMYWKLMSLDILTICIYWIHYIEQKITCIMNCTRTKKKVCKINTSTSWILITYMQNLETLSMQNQSVITVNTYN